jgi:tetratricopeptide (TPR) repeat protein
MAAARARALALGLLLAALASGCASFEGARLYGRGTRALERGDGAAAIADLERAAALVPRASEIHNHLGLAYGRAGRHAEALAAFRRAVALDCDNRAAERNLRAAEARAKDGVSAGAGAPPAPAEASPAAAAAEVGAAPAETPR